MEPRTPNNTPQRPTSGRYVYIEDHIAPPLHHPPRENLLRVGHDINGNLTVTLTTSGRMHPVHGPGR